MWEPGAATRIGIEASLASVAIGLVLAAFQVQGWTMPRLLAVILIVLLLLMVAVALSAILYEVFKAVRRFLEHRATSPSWVSSERPGLLDYEADGIRANERFTKELNKLNRGTTKLGEQLERHTQRFEHSKNASGKAKQRRANRSAKDIDKSAVFIEKRLDLLQALVKDIVRNSEGVIASTDIETDSDLAAAKEFRDTLAEGHEATTGALEGTSGYRESVKETEQMNLSRTMRIASRRLAASLDGVEKMLRKHQGGLSRLVQSLDTKIAEAERRQAARLERALGTTT
jgi:type III secretory pathway component EscS